MNIAFNKIKQPFYSLPFLAFIMWLVMVILLTLNLASSDYMHKIPYYWMLLFISVVSLIGCVTWSLSWTHWRKVLITSTMLYLALYLLRFYKFTFTWSEEGFLEAIKYVFYMEWLIFTNALSKDWLLHAAGYAFFEWVMPLLQLAFLIIFVGFSNKAFKRDYLR